MYDVIDADGNGRISPPEFQAYMDGVLRYVDDDSDGSMSFAEAAGGNGPAPPTTPATSEHTTSPTTPVPTGAPTCIHPGCD